LNWKEFLNWCRVHDLSVSTESEIPYGTSVEVLHPSGEKVRVNHYTTGKYNVQGKDSTLKLKISNLLGTNGAKSQEPLNDEFNLFMGSDESGKGDYFGPLVVVACYAPEEQHKSLLDMGIRDSKKIRDQKIRDMAEEIMAKCDYEAQILCPKPYNLTYDRLGNLNQILQEMHTKAHTELYKRCKNARGILVDQYTSRAEDLKASLAPLKLPVLQRIKAEAYLPVAAASILARFFFLKELDQMSNRWSMTFPKGASAEVEEAARDFLQTYSVEEMQEVAKMHFATSKKLGV